MRYYVDTCIWLNVFKKEGDSTKGKPYWKIGQEFFENSIILQHELLYSGVILRELQLNLQEDDYKLKRRLLNQPAYFTKVNVLEEDKQKARKLESKYNFRISFYDLVHLMISKRLNSLLITRDKKLIQAAKDNNVVAKRPEEL